MGGVSPNDRSVVSGVWCMEWMGIAHLAYISEFIYHCRFTVLSFNQDFRRQIKKTIFRKIVL